MRTRPGGPASWLRAIWQPEIGGALLVGLGIRLVLLPFFSDPYNYWGTYVTTGMLVRGVDPFYVFAADPRFRAVSLWGYPGLYFLFTESAYGLSLGNGFLYGILLRVPHAILDIGTTILLYRTARRLGGSESMAKLAALGFLFNPFSILVSSVWGTNDPIPVFFTALAVYLSLAEDEGSRLWGAWALGLGIAAKLYPILFLPLILARERRAGRATVKAALALIPVALTSLPFLLSDMSAYLGTLLHLTGGISGANAGLLDPQGTALQLLESATGPLNSLVSIAVAGLLLFALAWAVRRVRVGTMELVAAGGLLLCLAYLFSVRWNANYFLWTVPFVAVYAALRLEGLARWLLSLFWVPGLAFTLVYNGWSDPYTGANGFAYWTLIVGGPRLRPFEYLPSWTSRLLVALIVIWLALSALLFLFPKILALVPARLHVAARPRPSPPRIDGLSTRAGLAVLAACLVAAGGAAAYLDGHHVPITPTDFGTFSVQPDGPYAFADDFHADILSFRWSFQGDGRYALHAENGTGILLDTFQEGLAASLQADVGATSIHLEARFKLEAKYGLQPLVLFSEPGGRLAILTSRVGSALRLSYYDFLEIQSYPLDPPTTGWMDFRFDANATGRVVRILNTTLTLPPDPSLDWVRFGQPQDVVDGGGAFEIASVSMTWTGIPPAYEPSLPISALAAGAAIVASPLLIPLGTTRRARVKPKSPA